MKRALIAVTAILIATSQGWSMDSLAQHEWKNRVLILFGAANDPSLTRQLDVLRTSPDAIADRDLVVFQVTGDAIIPIAGQTGAIDVRRLRTEAKVQGDAFEAVLVGKDGGVKLRSAKPVDAAELFDLIDRMPMRRAGQR